MKRYSFRLDDPLDEAVRNILLNELVRMERLEKKVVDRDDAEALHRMRVSCRRMRTADDVFRPCLGKPAGEFRQFLRGTGRALGEMRDLQVLAGDMRAFAERSADRGETPGTDAEFGALDTALRGKREQLVSYLERPARREAETAFRESLAAGVPAWFRGRRTDPCARYALPAFVLLGYGRVLSFRGLFDAAQVSPEKFHPLRIATKVFRYTMEFADPAGGGAFRALVRTAVLLQDRLGALQDALMAAERVWRLAETGPSGLARSPFFAAFLADRRRAAVRLAERITPVWGKITGEPYKTALYAALSSY